MVQGTIIGEPVKEGPSGHSGVSDVKHELRINADPNIRATGRQQQRLFTEGRSGMPAQRGLTGPWKTFFQNPRRNNAVNSKPADATEAAAEIWKILLGKSNTRR